MDALAELWAEAGGEPEALPHIQFSGPAQVLPSIFAVTTAAAVAVGAANLAAARLWLERRHALGSADVRVDRREAAVAFRSERYLHVPDLHVGVDGVTGDYRARDGWIRLHCNYPEHRDCRARVLGLPTGDDGSRAHVPARGRGRARMVDG